MTVNPAALDTLHGMPLWLPLAAAALLAAVCVIVFLWVRRKEESEED